MESRKSIRNYDDTGIKIMTTYSHSSCHGQGRDYDTSVRDRQLHSALIQRKTPFQSSSSTLIPMHALYPLILVILQYFHFITHKCNFN